jgi:hypothetical protein
MQIEEHYLHQLNRKYSSYLSHLIQGLPFEPIRLLGGKVRPSTTKELEEGVRSFTRFEKTADRPGWDVSWETWTSKKLGAQQWPSEVRVNTEADLLHLLRKEKEVARFHAVLHRLKNWNPQVLPWLAAQPQRVLELQEDWSGLCAVMDYFMQHDVAGKYVRSLPVPVHTKFIQQNSAVLLSLLKHLVPERFATAERDLEAALGLLRKPFLFPIRWLDIHLSDAITSGMEVIAVTPEALQVAGWPVKEVWVVENETNLYLLPPRPSGMALFAKGYALHHLRSIPLFHQSHVFYWGDLDEDGFQMLHQFRQHYPHTQSKLMDESTVQEHLEELRENRFRQPNQELSLTAAEWGAWKLLKERNGRIEQERIRLDWVMKCITRTS